MKRLVFALLLSVGIMTVTAQEVRRAEPVSTVPDAEVAYFLAGVPLPAGSALSGLQKTPAYEAHVHALARLSQHYDQNYFSRIRSWSAAELAPRIPLNRPVYYFFGGPDAVSALAYFPKAPLYIMGGLEPVGSIASLQTLSQPELEEALANLRKSVEVVLSYGHFITKDMKAELDRTAFRGVLPLIYTFLALSGHEVLSTTYVGVRRDGTLQEYGATYGGTGSTLPGIKITFRGASGGAPQTIYYVQANVADDVLKNNNALLTWVGHFGPGNVYLKAASYLMHESYFSRIRTFLLSNPAVLQDDSGIPFRYFQDGRWQIWLFGTYSGTLEIFKKYHQDDLQQAFSSLAVSPLPFGTGYKWRLNESNLMLAVRQAVPRAQPVNGRNTP